MAVVARRGGGPVSATGATDTTSEVLEKFGAAYLRLSQSLADVGDSQWYPGRTPVARVDTTERSRGLVRDPVPATVFDQRRQALRAAAIEAERAQDLALKTMRAAEARLSAALAAFGTGSVEGLS